MGQLYDRIAGFDRAIADRWKTRTNESTARMLTPADVEFILGPVFRGRITENQGKALVAILEEQRQTPAAVQRVRALVNKAMDQDNLNLVPISTVTDLAPYIRALSHDVTGRILFKSPGTGITYAPFDYDVVCGLVRTGRVQVFEARLGGLSRAQLKAAATYSTNSERIVVYEHNSSDPLARTKTIVHEATHVIQDWRDLPSLIHHEETDAEIADSVVDQVLRGTVLGIDDDPVIVAAQFVIRQRVGEGDREWQKVYRKAVEQVAESVKKPGLRSIVETRDRRQNALYEQLLARVKAA